METLLKKAVMTPEFRLSFPSLFTPTADMNGRIGYRMEMLFPKSITMTELAEMRDLYNSAVPKKWIDAGETYRTFNAAFINGDKKKQPERKGHWILRASANEQYAPRLFGPNFERATPATLYAGCYCKAILSAYFYEGRDPKSGVVVNRGVAFNIKDVRKTRDGAPFGNMMTDEDADAIWGRDLSDASAAEMLGE